MENNEMNQNEEESKVKFINSTLIITTLVCLLPIAFGIYYYDQLPDSIARHFDLHGNPDGYSPKWMIIFGVPVVMAFCNIIENLASRSKKMPKQMVAVMSWIFPFVSIAVFTITFAFNLKGSLPFDMITFASLLVGFIFLIVGNYVPKTPLDAINLPELSGIADIEEATARYKKLVVRYMGRSMFVAGVILLATGFTPIRLPVFMIVVLSNLLLIPIEIAIAQHKIYKNK